MFVPFTRATGSEIIVNVTLVRSADEDEGGVTLRMADDTKIAVQGTLYEVFTKLNEARLS